jgi:hypothetical protein
MVIGCSTIQSGVAQKVVGVGQRGREVVRVMVGQDTWVEGRGSVMMG